MPASTVATHIATASMGVGTHLHPIEMALDQESDCRPGLEVLTPSPHDPRLLSTTTVVVGRTCIVIATVTETDHHVPGLWAAEAMSIPTSRATERGTVTASASGIGTDHPVTDDTMTGCGKEASLLLRRSHMEASLGVTPGTVTAERAADRLSGQGHLTENGTETADRVAADITLRVSKVNTDRTARTTSTLLIRDGSPIYTMEACHMMTSTPAAIRRQPMVPAKARMGKQKTGSNMHSMNRGQTDH